VNCLTANPRLRVQIDGGGCNLEDSIMAEMTTMTRSFSDARSSARAGIPVRRVQKDTPAIALVLALLIGGLLTSIYLAPVNGIPTADTFYLSP
jgi:hypothetical protein